MPVHGNRTLDQAIDEISRELQVRRRIYDRWVTECKLSRTDALDRMERLMTALICLTRQNTYQLADVPLTLAQEEALATETGLDTASAAA